MFDSARAVVERAIEGRAFPAAVVEVGRANDVLWQAAFGRLSADPDARPATLDTVFDLASLTKVIATAPMVMQLIERGYFSLDDRIAAKLPSWQGAERETVTVADLLAHCAGLTAYVPFFREHSGRAGFEPAICVTPLEYVPRTRSIYSDLGFMLLGFLIEDAGRAPLPVRAETLFRQIGIADRLQFNPPIQWRAGTAATELDLWRGRMLIGEVHDENTAALGGAAGHSGLFGTAAAVGSYARHLLQILDGRTGVVSKPLLETFIARRTDVPGSSRALAWDTMLPTSSCGTRMSARSFGHTGFTGTSLWIDPERGVYAVLLTNRVHPTREHDVIRAVRPAFHDAVMDALAVRAG
jgi:CubicO group peptidase (beta-lactamase class C family)